MRTHLLVCSTPVETGALRSALEGLGAEENPLGPEHGLVVQRADAAVHVSVLTPPAAGLEPTEITALDARSVLVVDVGHGEGSLDLAREVEAVLTSAFKARVVEDA